MKRLWAHLTIAIASLVLNPMSACSEHRSETLGGVWYGNGASSSQCFIVQDFGLLTLRNDAGVSAVGGFDGPRHVAVTLPSGKRVRGAISADGDRIDWDNGGFWSRAPH